MHNKRAGLLSSIKALAVIQFCVMIAPFLVFPYLIRVLGVEQFGLLSFALAISLFLQMFFDFGTGLYGARALSTAACIEERSKIVSLVVFVRIFLAVIVFAAYFPVLMFSEKFKNDFGLFVFAYALAFVNSLSLDWYFNGVESNRVLLYATILSKSLYTILVFMLISSSDQAPVVVAVSIACSCIQVAITFFWVVFKGLVRLRWVGFRNIFLFCGKSYHLFLSKIFVESYRSGGAIILGVFTTNEVVSYYAVAEKIVSIVQTLQFPVGKALMPYSTRSISELGLSLHKRKVKKIAPFVLAFYLIVVVVIIFMAEEIVFLVSGKAVPEIIESLLIISPVIFFGGLNYLMLCVYILPAKRDIFFRKTITFVCLLSLIMSLVLVGKIQHLSVVYSLLVAEIMLALFVVYDFLRSDT